MSLSRRRLRASTRNVRVRNREPTGTLRIRLARGKRQDADALILEMVLISEDIDTPDMPAGFATWLDAAHNVIHDTFFKMVEGRLEEQFQ